MLIATCGNNLERIYLAHRSRLTTIGCQLMNIHGPKCSVIIAVKDNPCFIVCKHQGCIA